MVVAMIIFIRCIGTCMLMSTLVTLQLSPEVFFPLIMWDSWWVLAAVSLGLFWHDAQVYHLVLGLVNLPSKWSVCLYLLD